MATKLKMTKMMACQRQNIKISDNQAVEFLAKQLQNKSYYEKSRFLPMTEAMINCKNEI